MSIQTTITIGMANISNTLPHSEAFARVEHYCERAAKLCGGASLNTGIGWYVSDAGKMVQESTATITVIDVHDVHGESLRRIAATICREFGEECVMLTRTGLDVKFIRGTYS